MPKSVFSEQYNLFRLLLIKARKSAKLSQMEVAEKLRRPQSYVSKYERGERRLDVIEFLEIAKALSLDPFVIIEKLLKQEEK